MDCKQRQWMLFGFGFNGFGQLNPPEPIKGTDKDKESNRSKSNDEPPHASAEDPSKQEPSVRTAERDLQPTALEMVMVVDTPKEIACFSCEPELEVSLSWDAVHIHAKTNDCKIRTITTGRWRETMKVVEKHLKENSSVMRITEAKRYLILQTESQTLVLDHRNDNVFPSELQPLQFNSLSDGKTYALMNSGDFHEVAFESKDKENDPFLSLGPQIQIGVPLGQVACGSSHILLLAQTGVVFSLGLNDRGQLGHGDIRPRPTPVVIEALDGIAMKDIACGHWHSVALSEFGDVYSWGWNEHKQLGHSVDAATIAVPTLIEADKDLNFISVGCGARHTVALSDARVLFVWGWNKYGQIGKSSSAVVSVPSQLSGLQDGVSIKAVYCGHWCTFVLAMQ